MPTLEFISIDVWRMVTQTANLVILFLLLKKFLFKPVQNILAKRQAEVDTLYNSAETAQDEAEKLRDDYTARLANAKAEANDIVKTATVTAENKSENILRETNAEVIALKAKAEADIAREKKKAVNEIKNEISGMAVDIAAKIVEREVDEKDHKVMIDEFINNVGDAI
ncbi:MAG: F0F1 ATP synthase subunit B [Oscillospiraceae bacterium]